MATLTIRNIEDGTKERLHGHNYTIAVALDVARIDVAAMLPFAVTVVAG